VEKNPMNHPESFWQAILTNPRDDAPRLRYANWLDERCDPLGEFIRVQCQLAKLLADDPHSLELETRQRELLAEYEEDWAEQVAPRVDWWVFRRGFIEEIGISTNSFLRSAETLFCLAPLQELHLYRVRERLEPLASSPYLEKASYLDLSSNSLRDQGAQVLARSPSLYHVRGLNLSSSGIGDSGVRALASSPHLQNLRELYLCDNRISDAGVRALAQSPLVLRLETLFLRFNTIGNDGAQLLHRRLGGRVHL
jgi:uncharacterized protein (TIGR02996 family)